MPQKVLDLFACWNHVRGRNARLFEDKECSVDGVRKNMISMLHMWAMVHYREELSTLEDFLNMCPLYIS
jgi:hypothetical protein